jgi:aryl-alcohol dehydrogenase-like predicted oxidoreductase
VTPRLIPGTDLAVSPICLGTALFGATIDTPAAYALLDGFRQRGGNFIDTARSYNDWIPGERGRSEGLIGRWLVDRRNRSTIVLATKGGHAGDDGVPRLNARDTTSDIDASLKRLRVDVIDVYYLHRDDTATPVAAIIDALNVHVRAGKIRYLGCSNWQTPRIREANAYASSSGQAGFVVNQTMWNAAIVEPARLPDQTLSVMDDEMRRMHIETDMACVPFSSQAGGLFSKLESPLWSLRFRLGRVFAGHPPAANRRRYKALAALAASKSRPVSQVVLAYLLSQPFVTVPIVGCRTLGQLVDSLAAADLRLSSEELAAIDGAR